MFEKNKRRTTTPSDSGRKKGSEPNPNHKEDFDYLLSKAVKKRK